MGNNRGGCVLVLLCYLLLYNEPQRDIEDHWAGSEEGEGTYLSCFFPFLVSFLVTIQSLLPASYRLWVHSMMATQKARSYTLYSGISSKSGSGQGTKSLSALWQLGGRLQNSKMVTGHPQETGPYGPNQGWLSAGTAEIDRVQQCLRKGSKGTLRHQKCTQATHLAELGFLFFFFYFM